MLRSRRSQTLGFLALLTACADDVSPASEESSSSSSGEGDSVDTSLTTSAATTVTGTTADTTDDGTTAVDGGSSSSDDSSSGASEGSGVCGNGMVESGEACDGDDLDGAECTTQGFVTGTLACAADCMTFDYAACSNCGDGNRGGTELCDGEDVDGETCLSQGHQGGPLGCSADCSAFDTTACSDDPTCDEEDLGSAVGQHVASGSTVGEDHDLDQSCADGGGPGRVLTWVAPAAGSYRFDTLGSNYDTSLAIFENCSTFDIACNDDVAQGLLDSRIVLDLAAGDLLLISVTGYGNSVGDWLLNINLDVPGGPCCEPHGSYGCDGGACETNVCAIDASCCLSTDAWDEDCRALAVENCPECVGICGNGVVDDAEECDGFDVLGQSCGLLGFDYGAVHCADDCTLDSSECADYVGDCCTDNGDDSPGCEELGCAAIVCDALPECCGNTWADDCAELALTACAVCNPDACGNNLIDGMDETCDGIDLAGEDCATQGYAFGELACADDCEFGLGSCNDVGACIEQNLGTAVGTAIATGSTVGEDEDLAQSCGADGAVDSVLLWTAPAAGTYRFDTVDSGYDTVLSLHPGCDAAATLCNDDLGFDDNRDSRIVRDVAAGEVVVIAVSGYEDDTGPWVLSVELDVPGTGECCVPHGTYGCDSEDGCADTVCAMNADCCNEAAPWTQECVALADANCASCM